MKYDHPMKKFILLATLLFAGCPTYYGGTTYATCAQYDAYGNCLQYTANYQTYGCSGYYDAYGNCISYGNAGYGSTCFQYDAYGNCISQSYSDGSFHAPGYHKNSRGEVYDGDGNRMPEYE